MNPKLLTKAQKRAALRAINLIKEKRDGRLKGRTVAHGRSQRALYEKSLTASPTVASADALFLTILIDTYEERDVATADVAGAYLKAFMDDYVLMKFTGASVDICEMNPEHIPFVAIENGVKVLYVRLVKAIYGCNLFSKKLRKMGFVLNPYDPCVANCVIDGSQCTIAWYIDDNKISGILQS